MRMRKYAKAFAMILSIATVLSGCGNSANVDSSNKTITQSTEESITEFENKKAYSDKNEEESTTRESLIADNNDPAQKAVSVEEVKTSADDAEQNTESLGDTEKAVNLEDTENAEQNYDVTEYDVKKTMYVTKPLNVRKGPGTEYEKVNSLKYSDEVKVTGQSGTWYRLENGNFVFGKYLSETKPAEQKKEEKPLETTIEGGNVVESFPEKDHNSITAEPRPEPQPEPQPEPTTKPVTDAPQTPEIPDFILNGVGIGNAGILGECDHDFVDLKRYWWPPTCGSESCGDGQCKKCGAIEHVHFPPTGLHNYEKELWDEPDCAGQGAWELVCTVCRDRVIEMNIFDPDNHVQNGTCYDALGNCYGCGVHIYDVECEHDFFYDAYWDSWWCRICEMGYNNKSSQ